MVSVTFSGLLQFFKVETPSMMAKSKIYSRLPWIRDSRVSSFKIGASILSVTGKLGKN